MAWINKKEIQLHGAFLLTTLGDRMWTFVIGFFMHKLGGMTWVAVQQLVDSLCKLVIITFIGQFLDRVNRSKIIQWSLLFNNAAVAVSAILFACLFHYQPIDYERTALLLCAAGIAALSKVASEIQRICFTKDWVVVISKSENVDLSRVNSFLLCIDQVSSMLLPSLSGEMLDYFNWQYVCAFIICYNFVSWLFESRILLNLYRETPQLKTRESEIAGDSELAGLKDVKLNSISMYFKQSSWTAGFGLSLLYMTVLGFDNLAASYGQKHGLSAAYIGLFRGFGSILGIAGAFSFQFVAKTIGLLWTVMIGLIWQNVFINMCGVSVLLPGSSMDVKGFMENTTVREWTRQVIQKVAHPEPQNVPAVPFTDVAFPVTLFFMGISFARFGLWLADPAITQIQQETIPESQRYMVFTVQTGFCELFSILKDIIVILFPFTPLFGVLTLGSCGFVFMGFMFNVFYHAQCGFSCHNKNMHLGKQSESEMVTIIPERQSLLLENGDEKPKVPLSEEEEESPSEEKKSKNGTIVVEN